MSRSSSALAVAFAASLCLAACGDDGGTSNSDTTSTSDATSTSDTTSTPDTTTECAPPLPALNSNVSVAPAATGAPASTLTGATSAGVTCTEPTRDAACTGTPAYTATAAFEYPWCGATIDGTDYTCNGCPDGVDRLQGRFRAIGFCPNGGDEDVNLPAPTTFAELLFVEGNSWYARIDDSSGTYEARGWYFCTEQGEHPNGHLFWVTTEVLMDTSGTAQVGDVYKTDVPLKQDSSLLLFYFDAVDVSTGFSGTYCEIGSTINGETCYDPYTRRP